MAEGIEVRTAKDGTGTYRASVWSNRDGRRIRKGFKRGSQDVAPRRAGAVRGGRMRAARPVTDDEAKAWLAGTHDGSVRDRSGGVYKPSTIRAYTKELDKRIKPAFGARRLTDLTRGELQDSVERLGRQGLSASSGQRSLLPLRAIYRRAIQRGGAQINPCAGVDPPDRSCPRRGCLDDPKGEIGRRAVRDAARCR